MSGARLRHESGDFAKIYDDVTTSTNTYIRGRVNINTASADVLTALLAGAGLDENTASGAAQTLITYRQQNPNNLNSIAWLMDALGNTSSAVQALAAGRLRHHAQLSIHRRHRGGRAVRRGYRRVKFIFDTSDGTPKIIYRQDLSRLGWALGEKARETFVATATP